MALITKKPIPKLRKASQPPLSYPGATADADRAKKPSLAEAAIKSICRCSKIKYSGRWPS